jgi:hypothetical protein
MRTVTSGNPPCSASPLDSGAKTAGNSFAVTTKFSRPAIQPAVLERPSKHTELSQLTFEVIAGDYSRPGNQPANYTVAKGRARRY